MKIDKIRKLFIKIFFPDIIIYKILFDIRLLYIS